MADSREILIQYMLRRNSEGPHDLPSAQRLQTQQT